jgi:N-acetylmuramoyl-L-alanine amidase
VGFRGWHGALAAVILAVAACSKGGESGKAPVEDDAVTKAQSLAKQPDLPSRPEVLSAAQAVEAQALREGAGARAVQLHALAAGLIERVFRREHRPEDAKEALDLYRAASQNLAFAGACDAGVRGAHLAGEAARDAGRTYAELYRIERRASRLDAGAACAAVLGDLERLAAFRPPPSVLSAIDQGLIGEGELLLGDAGARVSVVPKIVKLEHWAGDEGARLVVHLDKPARFRVGDEAGPGGRGVRTYVELDGTDLGGDPRDVPMGGIVTRARAESSVSGARVVLDLAGPAYRKVFHLVEPYRVVIDIAKNPPGLMPKGRRPVARVVVDPGHGGTDPGAIGPTGLKEKDVTLDIAHKLAPQLAKRGLQVTLTRDDDRFVTLEERTARANGFGADLFVSIHCNAAEARGRKGIETYVLDTTMTDLSARVAARENATSQAATAELSSILANMRIADQASRSTKLAELLQRAAIASVGAKYTDVTDGGVHTAGFYVLVGARMPAVLFETSYISNPVEEQRLASDEYNGRLVDALVNAVQAYREGR